jgi:hypothetical protein
MVDIQLHTNPETNIEVYINHKTGETFCSVSMLASLVGVAKLTISRKLTALSDGEPSEFKKAEMQTTEGVRRGTLIPEDVARNIIEYFAFDAGRYRTEKAKELARLMMQAGLRAYLYTVAGYKLAVQQKIAASTVPNYLPARKRCMDKLRDHGAKGAAYGMVEQYNNALAKLEAKSRDNLTREQADTLIINYMAGTIELMEREKGFAKNEYHLANTAKKAMRHEQYLKCGEDSVAEELKPVKERKMLKA